ncbi:response regulator transcription factor [Roseibacillus persicicus]|uniref:DNA-binding response regulator n=1 Tax=Roseibacillus persicicus TaxID=454148 RepID=A0A918TKA8_9BACT|nr:response regulator transcription factor [Roseibacillus persicicus]GHC48725.1 DNA-binding response regulator [Roseibacillus persicicus]
MKKNTLAVVEDERPLRELLEELIESSEGLELCASYSTAEDAIKGIPKSGAEIVLMDIQLPGMSGIECVAQLKRICPQILVLMVTIDDKNDRIFEALAAGASGYLLKCDVPNKLLESIQDLMSGGSPMSSAIARKVVQHFQHDPPTPADENLKLTPRETQILDLLAKGRLYKEIAAELGIGFATVHTHLQRVYDKLHVRTRTEAVMKYIGHGENSP